ncbi:5-formyltetrahydrofolate cyclo-ligase [Brevibacillus sp. H7]|uniref:5-formyltetrahydrofolate cyclo-ligase n=1 Tax=Brevibacillus sp. H7 TaxID=3349138 RepID=UPI003805BB85
METHTGKQLLRRKKLGVRAALSQEVRAIYSCQAAKHLLAFEPLAKSRAVLAFYPFREEIDIRPFLEAASKRGQEVWLPLTVPSERRMIPYRYTGPDVLRQGAYGIFEPDPSIAEQADLARLEAVIVPGVAFDRRGGRLGYGAGYYDRFLSLLSKKPLLIGCAFSCQLEEHIPMEPHDFRMDYIATEAGVRQAEQTC